MIGFFVVSVLGCAAILVVQRRPGVSLVTRHAHAAAVAGTIALVALLWADTPSAAVPGFALAALNVWCIPHPSERR